MIDSGLGGKLAVAALPPPYFAKYDLGYLGVVTLKKKKRQNQKKKSIHVNACDREHELFTTQTNIVSIRHLTRIPTVSSD